MKCFIKKKNKSIFLVVSAIVGGIIVPWLVMMFCVYVLLPNPPKPHITYSEFPFQLKYEIDGKVVDLHDVFICEFDGYDFNSGTGQKYRKWKGYFKSGNSRITLGVKDGLEIYCFSVSERWDLMAGRYMDDPDYRGRTYNNPPSMFYTDNFEEKSIDGILGEHEAWEKYKIRLISWECAPPIENKFE